MAEFSLKVALKKIAERRVETAEDSAITIAGRGRLDPGSPQARIARARQMESDLLDALEFLRADRKSENKAARIDAMLDRLGELAAEQGDYTRAAQISKSPERREHYQQIVKAIKRPDDEACDCEPDLIVDRANQTEFQSPAIMTIDTIIGKDGQPLNLDVCRKCGSKNAH